MKRVAQLLAQGCIYAGFAVILAYYSSLSIYERVPPDVALIKLSFAHSANRIGECHTRTATELSELAPNMRAALDCPRQRLNVVVQMKVDGELLYEDVLPPTGIHGDGVAITYQRLVVSSGRHVLEMALRDSARQEGFDYVAKQVVNLSPGQSLAVDFRPSGEGFIFE